ncbi:MAG: bifunctional 2-polyprenyl-6-hydroxyphenol methylase/3-demethylubiquinol 3-O-methyltransferase UbiG [Bacteriovoracaceae bacterium]|nr:bifunctional 2-polyprenyl-6-hydroxyphenol methylase/3-demethylubiquinol 3-O-methyltransferase UbiG [Bacteriovoracaceae bacterium]
MNQVNNEIYETLGDRWYTAFDDPIALLRAESQTKVPWVSQRIENYFKNQSPAILDVGCGGGFLSNALAKRGLKVTGVDLSPESINVARRHDETQTVQYLTADAYHLPFPDQSFDVVTAMDFLEHVEKPDEIIKEFSRVLKPGGIFIFHTFNRNFLAWLVIIKFVEWIVQNTPKDMHILRLFITPKELTEYCSKAGLETKEMTGIRPVLKSITLSSLFTGVIPKGMKFTLTSSLKLSYMGLAYKV